MIRTLNLVLLVTMMLALVGVYALKSKVEVTAEQKARLERQIGQQKAQLSMLEADWAVLQQPAHLAPIIARHNDALNLAQIKPEQYESFAQLPMRPLAPDPQAITVLLKALEAGVDPIAALIEAN